LDRALTPDQFYKFQSSKQYRLLCSKAPKPEPPPVTIKDGEQYCNLVVHHDVFESFDADEFEASMIHSIEPSSCTNEEVTTTKDDGTIKALENAIVFFETFCLPVPTNKDIEYPSHELDMKDTMVHFEYPDRTKFVSSMNHEQYEEIKTYNDLVVDASFFAQSCCPMVI
jgi:hypothetical protein